MISKYLGEDVFIEGIRRYLKKHTYRNTTTEDLWAALSDVSGKNIVRLADIWTKQVGYPVVTVTEDAKNSSIHLKQNRFLRTTNVKSEEDETLYPVVLGLRTKNGVAKSYILDKRQDTIKVPDLDFFKLNADHSGIYCTSYSSERLKKLSENADVRTLSIAGFQKTSYVLNLLKAFDAESEYVVWHEIDATIGAIRSTWIFEDDSTKNALKVFQRDLSSSKAYKLGWTFNDSDGHIEQQFKALMFDSAASNGDEITMKAAFEMFEKFTNGDSHALHPNLRASIFSIAVQYGSEKEYNRIVQEYETTKASDERNAALRSLGRAKNPKLIQRTLDYSMSKQVKDQDVYLSLSGLRTHREGIDALWAWTKENWEALRKRIPPSFNMLGSVVVMATSGLTREEQLKDVQEFFEHKSTKGFDRNLTQTIDAIQAKINHLNRDRSDVKAWLKNNKYL